MKSVSKSSSNNVNEVSLK